MYSLENKECERDEFAGKNYSEYLLAIEKYNLTSSEEQYAKEALLQKEYDSCDGRAWEKALKKLSPRELSAYADYNPYEQYQKPRVQQAYDKAWALVCSDADRSRAEKALE